MSKTSSASKIKMKSFEDLFGTNEVVGAKNISGEIRDIPLNSLHTFRNHPLKCVKKSWMSWLKVLNSMVS